MATKTKTDTVAKKAKDNTLVPVEDYLSAGVHIGTKFKTKSMKRFIYKINDAGLSILDIQKIDERLRIAAKFLAKFNPEDILVVSRRENGWKAVKSFAKVTGAKQFAGRYPVGVLTNIQLDTFIEPKVVVVADPWTDKNVVADAVRVGIPIVALCDTNNTTQNIDVVIPGNNKGLKSLAIVFWILANTYMHEKGELPKSKNISIPVEDFGE